MKTEKEQADELAKAITHGLIKIVFEIPDDFMRFIQQYESAKKVEIDAREKEKQRKITKEKQEESERTKKRKELAIQLSEHTERIINWLNSFKNSEALKKIVEVAKLDNKQVVHFEMLEEKQLRVDHRKTQEMTFFYNIYYKEAYFTVRNRPARGCGALAHIYNEKDLINEAHPKVILEISDNIKTGKIWEIIKQNLE